MPGENGRDGAPGANGRDGIDGRDGERGPQGPAGKLPIVREWHDAVFYEGDVVTFDGRTFQALCDTGKAPTDADWICLADRGADGRDGSDGKSFVVRGTWLEINEYRALDVVTLNGASFAAKTDNPGPCPGGGWQLIASQGKRGDRGERGPVGERGERGAPGLPVVALTLEDTILTITNADGSTVTCDLYDALLQVTK
ncbi:hypothetical protein GCM10011335_37300 [Aureimonas glaciei]|uniref:Collagen-like protein n=1 Tax=Aureimonas glaciei TaxID=1776957 RepID=A0A917DE89_9HYPH|nr:hypothetical protein GCM10011335_37300 [Aureimonas glaciei]